MRFQMRPQNLYTRNCIITLIAFVCMFYTACNSLEYYAIIGSVHKVWEVCYQFLSLAVQRGNSSIAPHTNVENVLRQTADSATLTFSHILISLWIQWYCNCLSPVCLAVCLPNWWLWWLIENLRNSAGNGGISRGITRDIQAPLPAGFRRFDEKVDWKSAESRR